MESHRIQVWIQHLVTGLPRVFTIGHNPPSQILLSPLSLSRGPVSLLRGLWGGVCYQPLTLELLGVPLQTACTCLGHAKLVLALGFLPLPLPLPETPFPDPSHHLGFCPNALLFPPWYLALPEMTLLVHLYMWPSVCWSPGLTFVDFCTCTPDIILETGRFSMNKCSMNG